MVLSTSGSAVASSGQPENIQASETTPAASIVDDSPAKPFDLISALDFSRPSIRTPPDDIFLPLKSSPADASQASTTKGSSSDLLTATPVSAVTSTAGATRSLSSMPLADAPSATAPEITGAALAAGSAALQDGERAIEQALAGVQSTTSAIVQTEVGVPEPALLGAGGVGVALLAGLLTVQQQSRKTKKELSQRIEELEASEKRLQESEALLEGNVDDLGLIKDSLQADLKKEISLKSDAVVRGDELQSQLDSSMASVSSLTGEKQMLIAELTDTRKDLAAEKKAGAKLGDQVINLSAQLEAQTSRAEAAEESGAELAAELKTRSHELEDEQAAKQQADRVVDNLAAQVEEFQVKCAEQQDTIAAQEESGAKARAEFDRESTKAAAQIQSSKDKVIMLSESLAQTTTSLEATELELKRQSDKLATVTSQATNLKARLDNSQHDLEKAHQALDNQQTVNSQLRVKEQALDKRVRQLSSALEDTTSKLSSESCVASELKTHLAELKMEYIAAGDKLEAEQGHIRKLESDLQNMESALNSVSYDKKAAQMENAQLHSQLNVSQKSVLAAQSAQQAAAEELRMSVARSAELQKEVSDLCVQVKDAQELVAKRDEAVRAEQLERSRLEVVVAELSDQVISIEQAETAARTQAQEAMSELRRDLEMVRSKARKNRAPASPPAARPTNPVSKAAATAVVTSKDGQAGAMNVSNAKDGDRTSAATAPASNGRVSHTH